MRISRFILVVLLVASRSLAADPLDLVKRFYGETDALGVSGFSYEDQMARVRPSLTDDLNACFTEARKAVGLRLEKELQKGEEVEIDGKKQRIPLNKKFSLGRMEVFTNSGEGAEYLGLGESSVSSSRAYVQVKMKLPGEEVRWTDLLILHLTKSGWKVDDILFQSDDKESFPISLRRGLEDVTALANDESAWDEK